MKPCADDPAKVRHDSAKGEPDGWDGIPQDSPGAIVRIFGGNLRASSGNAC